MIEHINECAPTKKGATLSFMKLHIAQHLQDTLPRIYADMTVTGLYTPDAGPAGKRALRNTVLSLISKLDGGKQAAKQFAGADNMTQQLSALANLIRAGQGDETAGVRSGPSDHRHPAASISLRL